MNAWAEADMLKAARATPGREWRAFAKLLYREGRGVVASAIRVRGRENDATLKLERPCYFRRGAWRALGRVRVTHLERDFAALMLDTNEVAPSQKLRVARLEPWREVFVALRVAHDEWLSKGAPRVTRLKVIEVPQ